VIHVFGVLQIIFAIPAQTAICRTKTQKAAHKSRDPHCDRMALYSGGCGGTGFAGRPRSNPASGRSDASFPTLRVGPPPVGGWSQEISPGLAIHPQLPRQAQTLLDTAQGEGAR